MGLDAGEVVPIEGVDNDTQGEIEKEQEEGLSDDGGRVRVRFGELGRLRFGVSHNGQGRRGLAAVNGFARQEMGSRWSRGTRVSNVLVGDGGFRNVEWELIIDLTLTLRLHLHLHLQNGLEPGRQKRLPF